MKRCIIFSPSNTKYKKLYLTVLIIIAAAVPSSICKVCWLLHSAEETPALLSPQVEFTQLLVISPVTNQPAIGWLPSKTWLGIYSNIRFLIYLVRLDYSHSQFLFNRGRGIEPSLVTMTTRYQRIYLRTLSSFSFYSSKLDGEIVVMLKQKFCCSVPRLRRMKLYNRTVTKFLSSAPPYDNRLEPFCRLVTALICCSSSFTFLTFGNKWQRTERRSEFHAAYRMSPKNCDLCLKFIFMS